MGYSPVDVRKDYRNNDRIVLKSEQLAQQIWDRVKVHLENEIATILERNELGYGNQGSWTPVGLNECFRFCKLYTEIALMPK